MCENNMIEKQGFKQYKYLTPLAMIYITVMLSSMILAYKYLEIGTVVTTGAAAIFPLSYFLSDIITEVYGFNISRRLIWTALFCELIFVSLTLLMIKLPSPLDFHHQKEFNFVIGSMPRVYLATIIAVLLGAFINAYAISKLKILARGKLFWLRSITSSAFGEAAFTILVDAITYYGIVANSRLAEMITVSFSIKILSSIILAIPGTIAVHLLKVKESVDVFDYKTNFNPFRLNTEKE